MANCIIGYGLPGCGYVKFLKNLEKSLDNLTIVNIKKLCSFKSFRYFF